MGRNIFGVALGIIAAAGLTACDTGMAPETASLGSMLDPDGAAVAAPFALASHASGSGISSGNASLRAMAFTATLSADGTASGQYTVVLNGNDRRLAQARGKIMGRVTCLRIVDNRAFIAGDARKDELEAFPLPIGGVAIEVVDGGEGSDAVDEVSPVGLYASVESANQWCATTGEGPTFQADHGQIQIR